MRDLTQEELDRLVGCWRKRLRLRDWDVRTSYQKASFFPDDRHAEADFQYEFHKILSINLRRCKDMGRKEVPDVENSIVHELLHAHVRSFYLPTSVYDDGKVREMEQVVSILTDALIRGRRLLDKDTSEWRVKNGRGGAEAVPEGGAGRDEKV